MLLRSLGKRLLANGASQNQVMLPQLLRASSNTLPIFRENIYNVSKRHFSAQNDDNGNNNPVAEKEPRTEECSEQEIDSFESFGEFLKSNTSIPENAYFYSSKVVFENRDEDPKLEKYNKRFAFRTIAWSAVSLGIVSSSFPLFTILSAIPIIKNIGLFSFGIHLTKHNIMKIELLNNTQVKIYTLSKKSKGFVANIKDIKLIQSKHRKTVLFVRKLDNPTFRKPMLLYLQPESIIMPNIYLFKSIVHGEVEEVSKFRYVEEDGEDTEENDE